MPTCPQQEQQKNKLFESRFKIDDAASPMPEPDSQTPRAPGDIKSEWWARSSRNPGRDQIGTPGRDHRNQHSTRWPYSYVVDAKPAPSKRGVGVAHHPLSYQANWASAESVYGPVGNQQRAALASQHLNANVCQQEFLRLIFI